MYGAIREQMDVLEEKGIAYDYCPGVSAVLRSASALKMEYTLPGISQTVIITRMAGPHAGTGARRDCKARLSRLYDGHFPEHRHAREAQ